MLRKLNQIAKFNVNYLARDSLVIITNLSGQIET